MLTWDGKCPEGLNPPQRTTDNQGVLKVEEINLPQGRTNRLVIQYQIVSLENIQIRNITQIDKLALMYLELNIYHI